MISFAAIFLAILMFLQVFVEFGFISSKRKKMGSLIFCQILLIIGYILVGFLLGWTLFR